MSQKKREESSDSSPSESISDTTEERPEAPGNAGNKPVEVGGRDGPDPVRYGDWEKGGRCIDF